MKRRRHRWVPILLAVLFCILAPGARSLDGAKLDRFAAEGRQEKDVFLAQLRRPGAQALPDHDSDLRNRTHAVAILSRAADGAGPLGDAACPGRRSGPATSAAARQVSWPLLC